MKDQTSSVKRQASSVKRQKQSAIVMVGPEVVRGNPWQVRGLDEELVVELEAVIREHGFRGVLVGRAVSTDVDGERQGWQDTLAYLQQDIQAGKVAVELAWGHHRLEAAKRAGVQVVTVEVVYGLTDEEMASWGLMENVRRRDLSAIDEARAIQRLVEEFDWTQAMVAESLGYASKATVSNKLRLLRLPEVIQEKVQSGEMAERRARSLVTLAEVSEKRATKLVEDGRPELTDSIVRRELLSATKGLVGVWDKAPWPMDWVPVPTGPGWVACEKCGEHLRLGDEVRCRKPSCWRERKRLWEAELVATESAVRGIPALEEGVKGIKFDYRMVGKMKGRCKDRDGGGRCPFSRLGYDSYHRVVEMCGSEEEFDRCCEWHEVREAEEVLEERAGVEVVLAVMERGAKVLGREFEGVRREVVEWLAGRLKSGWGWREMPEGLAAVQQVGWAILGRATGFSGYEVPALEKVEAEVERVLGELGVGEGILDIGD